jgi:hypothetical protein
MYDFLLFTIELSCSFRFSLVVDCILNCCDIRKEDSKYSPELWNGNKGYIYLVGNPFYWYITLLYLTLRLLIAKKEALVYFLISGHFIISTLMILEMIGDD